MKNKQPAFFIAHGSPMNAIEQNSYTDRLIKLGEDIEKPKAIMVISAHWVTKGSFITSQDAPKEIYDFYGFPEELYKVKYSTKGGSPFIKMAFDELAPHNVRLTDTWGLDHGAWSVLKHIFKEADVPVFQLSLNAMENEEYHYNLGKSLNKLREKGIMVLASGNIIHNLGKMKFHQNAEAYDWALDFDKAISEAIKEGRHRDVINYKQYGKSAVLSVPTNEHFLPLLYILGLKSEDDKLEFIFDEIYNGSLSMRCIKIG